MLSEVCMSQSYPLARAFRWRRRAPDTSIPHRDSRAHGGREQIQPSGAGVVPHQMEGAAPARRDALVVADPPRSMLAAAGRGVRVERGAGDPYRWQEAELPGPGYQQDLVHAAAR